MFKNQPKGLYVLALSNTGERFGYYTMLAIFLFYLQAKFGFDSAWTGQIFSIFLALVYFMPLVGGWLADKWSFSKCVVTGIAVMFIGYALLSAPTPVRNNMSVMVLFAALLLISVGTGLFKGNLQVMVGDLYNNPQYSDRRDTAFSLFYMAINLGSMYAPGAAIALKNYGLRRAGFLTNDPMMATVSNWCLDTDSFTKMPTDPETLKSMTEFATQKGMAAGGDLGTFLSQYISDFAAQCDVTFTSLSQFATDYITAFSTGCSYAFSLACVSLIVSFLIYTFGRKTYAHIITDKKSTAKSANTTPEVSLTPEQTKQRVVALLLVFTVVIFFWMVFHQNGQTLTEFAKSCTASETGSWTRIGFNLGALTAIFIGVYAFFSLIQSATAKSRLVSGIILALCVAAVGYIYIFDTPAVLTGIDPAAYQQFNPFYVVVLTPFSIALFSWLARMKKEPSAPRKIGYGMLVAGIAYIVMVFGSLNLVGTNGDVSPNWLITTYLLLTFAELLLSPMGISFVSKVAPPKLKGSMMGGWFAATAIGNYLVSIPMLLWGKIPVAAIWGILICLCFLSGAFIFSIMKKLEAATDDQPAPEVADPLETIEDDVI
ncbi:MAG: peptide MFS transporter [Bacteroidales bacterium]|nr:peptide MFS transporter [Bacteroidales bacterium]MBD5219747.1 peptide MFS transporter [Bacteroidales bacterium]